MTADPLAQPGAPAAAAEFAAAVQRYREGAFDEAAGLFGAICERRLDDPVPLRLQGLALVRAGKAAAGLPLLARARAASPENAFAQLHYGVGLQAAGRFAEAAAVFRACRPLLPDNPAPPLNLAAALLELGEAGTARDAAMDAVRLAPGSAEAHYTLGLAEMALRAWSAASGAFEEAVRLAPKLVDGWVSLGLARYRLGNVWGATVATNRALALDPANAAADANLAVFMALRGQQEEALNRLRATVARDPGCVPARINLASQLIIDHEPAEALAALEGPPPAGQIGVHWRAQRVSALLGLGRRAEARTEFDAIEEPFGDAEILIAWRRLVFALADGERERAEALAERVAALAADEEAAVLEHRIIAYFDLARFRGSRGETERAFEHWRQGHALVARTQPFSREEFAGFVDASIACYGAHRLRDGPAANNRDMTPLFIVGLPRSGTTLMEQILAAHPAVHGAGERPNLHSCLTLLGGPALRAEAVRKAAALDGWALGAAARQYLVDLHALAPGVRYVADKMPGNALHLGFLATLLPRARVIVCERDPRDIGTSIFQLRFFGYHPYAHDLADLGWYIGQHQRLLDHWKAVLPLPMLSVSLVDWIEDFGATLTRVLDFLGLPYDSACERFYEQRRRVRTASAAQVRRPINARGLGRWKRYAAQLVPMIRELEAAGLVAPGPEPPQNEAAAGA